jgi:hypothetical protein
MRRYDSVSREAESATSTRNRATSAACEVVTVEREIRKLVQAIKNGVSALSIKDELLSLESRKAELQSRLNAPEMPELLHPRMADVYREKVGSLCSALENEENRTGAVEAIRALIETILLEPEGEELKITLKGHLAGMLSAAKDSKRSPDAGDLLVQIKLVAGARNQLLARPTESSSRLRAFAASRLAIARRKLAPPYTLSPIAA